MLRVSRRLEYLREVVQFKPITFEICAKRKLCTVSAEQGRFHCARPAFVHYHAGNVRINYLCFDHSLGGPPGIKFCDCPDGALPKRR